MGDGNGRFALRHALFSLSYYGANAIYQGYMSLYYTYLGFHSAQLGGISAATALAALGAQPLWGMLGDRARDRRRLLGALALLSAAALPLALLGEGYGYQLAVAMLFYAFFCALLPLNDAILLEKEGAVFGGYRLAGGGNDPGGHCGIPGVLGPGRGAGHFVGGFRWTSGIACGKAGGEPGTASDDPRHCGFPHGHHGVVFSGLPP